MHLNVSLPLWFAFHLNCDESTTTKLINISLSIVWKLAESEGAIRMADNEVFDVVELDQGDGWTRVRRPNLEEGFVPTSYLEIELFEK